MQRNNKKLIHLSIIIVIIFAIIFTALILILKYNEDGETNMPFSLSKISIISTVDALDVENNEHKWNLQVNQNNDIYIYINKNNDYKKTETIKNIKIDNFVVKKEPVRGQIAIYKPSKNEKLLFENNDEYKAEEIVFEGNKETDIKNLKVANQGDKLSFRCSNNNIGTYISDDDKEVNFDDLLKKIDVTSEELKLAISFDMTIELNSKKSFKATLDFDLPVGDIVQEGRTNTEITDLEDFIFKRIEN